MNPLATLRFRLRCDSFRPNYRHGAGAGNRFLSPVLSALGIRQAGLGPVERRRGHVRRIFG